MRKRKHVVAVQDVGPVEARLQEAERTVAQLVEELRREQTRALLFGHLVHVLDDFYRCEGAPRYVLQFPQQGSTEPVVDDVHAVQCQLIHAARAARRRFRQLQSMLVDGQMPALPLPPFSVQPQDEVVPFDEVADLCGIGEVVENPQWRLTGM
jgi:hypothetical protein